MSYQKITKNVRVSKVEPRNCALCPLPATHFIGYNDRDRESEYATQANGQRFKLPIISKLACDDHLVQVTLQVLAEANPEKEPAPDADQTYADPTS